MLEYGSTALFGMTFIRILLLELFCRHRASTTMKHKIELTKRTKCALHTSPSSGLLLSWSSPRPKSLDQLDQPNQIIHAKPGAAFSDDFDGVRCDDIGPPCGERPEASFLIVEIHPAPVPILAVLEDFQHTSFPGMERVRDSTPPH